jgi:hypothetical protein
VRQQLRLGRAMRRLPHVRAAFLAGEISSFHVSGFAALSSGRCAEALEEHEEMLVEQAKVLGFETFTRYLAYFEQMADPDGSDDKEQQRRTRRDVSLAQSLSGMWLGRITLDPVSGEIVAGELRAIDRELYDADRAEATRRLGHDPSASELRRSSNQRRADALVKMARRSGTNGPDGAAPAPLFSVLVDYETLHGRICELASGQVVSPGALVPFLDEAIVERAVFGPGARVEMGAHRRLFDGATRRAIELRDRGCVHPYCDKSAPLCQVDHIVPFSAGGLSTQENGRVLCGFHNRLAYRQWLALDEATRAALVARQRHGHDGERQDDETPEASPLDERGPPALDQEGSLTLSPDPDGILKTT